MSTEFIIFFVFVGALLLYPAFGLIHGRKFRALKSRLAAEQCPKCREVFGPSIIRTAREVDGFFDPAPPGPILGFICPHCGVGWEYCDGSYTIRG
jgi:hypothetical protein